MQFEVGSILTGKVTGITKFGAFVELESGKTGMVHISEVAATYVKEITDHLSVGQEVKVKVLTIGEDGKISLSIKKALEQPTGGKREYNGAQKSHHNNGYRNDFSKGSRPAGSEATSFDDMLSRFMQSSDEKMSDLKRFAQPTRNSSRRK